MYCNSGRLAKDCIAIHQVILQVERGLGRDKCIATRLNDIGHCIAIQKVYCDSGLGGWAGSRVATWLVARPRHDRWGSQDTALGT